MPFHYDVPVPDLVGSSDDAATVLIEWLRPIRSWVEQGDAIASVRRGTQTYEVLVNGPGLLAEHCHAPGATLKRGQPLAVMHADGESIPYGKAYSVARAT